MRQWWLRLVRKPPEAHSHQYTVPRWPTTGSGYRRSDLQLMCVCVLYIVAEFINIQSKQPRAVSRSAVRLNSLVLAFHERASPARLFEYRVSTESITVVNIGTSNIQHRRILVVILEVRFANDC